VTKLRGALLRWYRRHRRDLPWRRTRDPWAIWVSEAMLQQTRVETVVPYYERFLRRFPDVGTLASADVEDVLGLWAGLGYYSRARNLHGAARQVMGRFRGRIPETAEALRTLPGVGRYTAGALASIAFDRPEPVVDGNVARVLARLHGIREDLARPAVQARLWEEAERLARGPHPGDLNQALMELGARVCTPKTPDCAACPVAFACRARRAGETAAIPRPRRRPAPRRVRAVAALVARGGRVLAVRRAASGLFGGLWDLPGGEIAPRAAPGRALPAVLAERTGLALEGVDALGVVTHLLTHRSVETHVFRARAAPGRVRLSGYVAHRWVGPEELHALPQGRAARRTIALALDRSGDAPALAHSGDAPALARGRGSRMLARRSAPGP
jgi:A/G-specific adenine glycosylase